MNYLSLLFVLLFTAFSFGQSTIDFHGAALLGKFAYKDYEAFGASYNEFYANDPDLIKPFDMKTFATGYQFGSTFNLNEWFNGSIDIARVRSGVSTAEWGVGFTRGLQLRSFLFDMDCGFYVLPDDIPFRVSFGLGVSLQSTQIHSFMDFEGTRSYGSETRLNGIWSSWRGNLPLVLKLSYTSPDDHWKYFINTKFPIYNKKINSVGYTYSAEFTSNGDVFPADFKGNWAYENRLSENFRFMTIAVGIAYQISLL